MIEEIDGVTFVFVDSFENESSYYFDSTYYIHYNVQKALYALSQLEGFAQISKPDCTLCHVYADLLFEACGSLRNRFRLRKGMSASWAQQVKNNRSVYGFDSKSFPWLLSSEFRNFIEHVDERADLLISNESYFGAFTIVYREMDEEIRKGICSDKKLQNCVLNLEDMTYRILVREKDTFRPKTIPLLKLKNELVLLRITADKEWSKVERQSRMVEQLSRAGDC